LSTRPPVPFVDPAVVRLHLSAADDVDAPPDTDPADDG
jgi:hypothetical protein